MIKKEEKVWKIALWVAFFGYLVFNGILLLNHEPWRDEANVWLIARELSPIELFAEIKYQGHPCLWYLLLMPVAKLGFPFQTINVTSYSIMAVVAGLFLFKAPLSKFMKIVVVFSPIFSYYYSVVARNYCLAALLMILLALWYLKRNEKPVVYGVLLGLLVQADIIALVPAGIISFMWLCENMIKSRKDKSWKPFGNMLKGIWIPLISLFMLIAQFYHISDSPVYVVKEYDIWGLINELKLCSQRIFWGLTGLGENYGKTWLILFIILAVIISVLLKDAWPVIVAACTFVFQIVFSAFIYSLHLLHFIFLCYVVIWLLWVWGLQQQDKGLTEKKSFNIFMYGVQFLFLTLSLCMFVFWNSDTQDDNLGNIFGKTYSDGINVANYITDNIGPEEIFVSDYVPRASTVIAFLDEEYDFYYAGSGKRTTYADWSKEQSKEIMFSDLLVWAKERFPEKEVFYLLTTRNSCIKQNEGLAECEMVYQTIGETTKGEEYTLYCVPIER